MYRNRKRSENDQYNETSNHIQMKGGDGRGPGLGPPGRGTRPCRRTLSFVYGLMSHCIDRFHFVFYLYTFHFVLPMCIRLIFLLLFSIIWLLCFIFTSWYSKNDAYLTILAVGRSRPTHKIELPICCTWQFCFCHCM